MSVAQSGKVKKINLLANPITLPTKRLANNDSANQGTEDNETQAI